MKLAVVVASTRPGRIGPAVGQWFYEYAQKHGQFEVQLVDLATFKLPLLDEPNHPLMRQYEHDHTMAWSKVVDEADAYVFVTPEYDYFAPAALVNALQVVAHEWHYKPAGLVGYGGISGGLRSIQAVKPLMSSVKLVALPESVAIQQVGQHVSEGIFKPEAFHEQTATVMLDELHKWATALQPLHAKK